MERIAMGKTRRSLGFRASLANLIFDENVRLFLQLVSLFSSQSLSLPEAGHYIIVQHHSVTSLEIGELFCSRSQSHRQIIFFTTITLRYC